MGNSVCVCLLCVNRMIESLGALLCISRLLKQYTQPQTASILRVEVRVVVSQGIGVAVL